MYRVPLYRPTTRIPKDFTCNVAKFTREIVAQPLVSSPACHTEISWSGSMWPKACLPPPPPSSSNRFYLFHREFDSNWKLLAWIESVSLATFSSSLFRFCRFFSFFFLSLFLFFFFSYQLDDSQQSLSMSRKRK